MAIVAVIMSVNFMTCVLTAKKKVHLLQKEEHCRSMGTNNLRREGIIEPYLKKTEWSHAPKDECEYFGNLTFRADGTYTES